MRIGSKGVKNKNLKNMHGKPLMAHTITQAVKSQLFEHIVVSTDSKEIAKVAKEYGAESWFIRPNDLATDQSAKIPVIQHALLESEKYYNKKFNTIVDLDATSPLRAVDDIKNAYSKFISEDADILISASPSRKNPYFNMVEKLNGKVKKVVTTNKPIFRRQDAPKVYDMNASIYFWKRDSLLNSKTLFTDKTSLYIMPEERSIDIDTELDWEFVEFLFQKKLTK